MSSTPKDPIVFLTNRFNLLEILSSLQVTPRAGLGKYYRDFLEVSPGRIPLFQTPIGSELGSYLTRSDLNSFPVAVEVDPSALGAITVSALSAEDLSTAVPLETGRALVWAAGGVIPSTAITRIHFQSKGTLEEHAVREYDNVQPGWPELVVTPQLFEGGPLQLDKALKWLGGLEPIEVPSEHDFIFADRLAGARCLAAFSVPADLVDGLMGFLNGNDSIQSERSFPKWLTTANSIRPRDTAWRGKGLDERLYCSVVRVLQRTNPTATWRPLEVLDHIEGAVAGTKLTKKDQAQVGRQLAAIRAILRNEKELRPFRRGVGSSVLKGLLMTLMRPEPDRLFSWSKTESGADNEVMLAASVFAGILQGHRRISVHFRPLALDRFVSVRSSHELSAGLTNAFAPRADTPSLTVARSSANTESGGSIEIRWEGQAILSRKMYKRPLLEMLSQLDCQKPETAGILADFCLQHGWKDCMRSIVTTTERTWNTAPRANGPGLEIMVLGPVAVRVEILEEALRERVAEAMLSAADEQALLSKLAAS